jgi:hypothetical protein
MNIFLRLSFRPNISIPCNIYNFIIAITVVWEVTPFSLVDKKSIQLI